MALERVDMYRIVSLIVIGGFVSIMLYFHQQNSHYGNKTHANHMEEHENFDISNINGVDIPEIDGRIKQDRTGNWMLKITTKNFIFKPEKLGSNEQKVNEGHAHLYINGEKKNRIYGQYFDLGTLKPGVYDVRVTLNTNDHRELMFKGKQIAFQYKLKVE